MKPCKAKLTDGNPCPNQVDEGQEYCPYHLASQVAGEMRTLSNILSTWAPVFAVASIAVGKTVIGKVVKLVVSKKL